MQTCMPTHVCAFVIWCTCVNVWCCLLHIFKFNPWRIKYILCSHVAMETVGELKSSWTNLALISTPWPLKSVCECVHVYLIDFKVKLSILNIKIIYSQNSSWRQSCTSFHSCVCLCVCVHKYLSFYCVFKWENILIAKRKC